VWARELMMPTGIGESLAVPHAAHGDSLDGPIVAIGLHHDGVDFEVPGRHAAATSCACSSRPAPSPTSSSSSSQPSAHSFGGGRATTLLDDVSTYTELRAHLRAAAPEEEAA
jgi:hypothetical protein